MSGLLGMLGRNRTYPSLLGVLNINLTPGNDALTIFLIGLSVVVILWGFERYRKTFSKLEFLVAILVGIGVLSIGVSPGLYAAIGDLLNLQSRLTVTLLIANITFVVLLMASFAMIRNTQFQTSNLVRSLATDQISIDDGSRGGIYVVIPAYNEAGAIQEVVNEIPDKVCNLDITPVVVSDGSTDETAEKVRKTRALMAEHPINQGQGGALQTGFTIAQRMGAEIVVTLDADGQHPTYQMEKIVEPIVNNEADYVIGSRYSGVDNSGNGFTRHSGIRVFTALINLLANTSLSDCTNGFRAIRGSELSKLTLTEDRFNAPELIIEAKKNGLRIREESVTINERNAGETKKPKLGYAIGLVRTILITWIR